MAFENINTVSLRNSINNCIDTINYSNSVEIISKITSNDIWSTASRDVFSKALSKMVNQNYKNLEKKLDKYLQIVDKIEEYQKLSSANINLANDISNLQLEIESFDNLDELSSVETKKIDDINEILEKNSKEIATNDSALASIKSSIEELL